MSNTDKYHAYYCEENVWHLCADPRLAAHPRAAILVSNPARTVAVAYQRAAPRPELPIVWDYHVVLAARDPQGLSIWDLDTTLGMPVPLLDYLGRSLAWPHGFAPPHEARFRVLEAGRYREVLCTDRSHMRDAAGRYRVPPPPWPAIGTGTNLMRLVDMDDPIAGEVVALAELPAALARLLPAS